MLNLFDRLATSAERMAMHPAFPGKQEAVDQAIEDLDDLVAGGRITESQRDVLRGILLGGCLQPA